MGKDEIRRLVDLNRNQLAGRSFKLQQQNKNNATASTSSGRTIRSAAVDRNVVPPSSPISKARKKKHPEATQAGARPPKKKRKIGSNTATIQALQDKLQTGNETRLIEKWVGNPCYKTFCDIMKSVYLSGVPREIKQRFLAIWKQKAFSDTLLSLKLAWENEDSIPGALTQFINAMKTVIKETLKDTNQNFDNASQQGLESFCTKTRSKFTERQAYKILLKEWIKEPKKETLKRVVQTWVVPKEKKDVFLEEWQNKHGAGYSKEYQILNKKHKPAIFQFFKKWNPVNPDTTTTDPLARAYKKFFNEVQKELESKAAS